MKMRVFSNVGGICDDLHFNLPVPVEGPGTSFIYIPKRPEHAMNIMTWGGIALYWEGSRKLQRYQGLRIRRVYGPVYYWVNVRNHNSRIIDIALFNLSRGRTMRPKLLCRPVYA